MVSCDQVDSIVSKVVGETLPKERREGISKVHEASASDMKLWLAEPNVLVVLDFYSENCPPCKVVAGHLDVMATKYSDKSAIMKLNVGRPGELATMAMNEYRIDQTPVLKFFLNGEEVKELRGQKSEEEIDAVFSRYTSKIEGEFTMLEGDLPGGGALRTVEEMMVRGKKSDLPVGMTRVKVPTGSKQVTEAMPKSLLNASAAKPAPAAATKKSQSSTKTTKTSTKMSSTDRARAISLGQIKPG